MTGEQTACEIGVHAHGAGEGPCPACDPEQQRVWPTIDWFVGYVEEHARWMRTTIAHAQEFDLPVEDLRKAHSLLCNVLREARSRATGLSEEEIGDQFMEKLRNHFGYPRDQRAPEHAQAMSRRRF